MKKTLEYGADSPYQYTVGNDGREEFPHGTNAFRMSVHRTQYANRSQSGLVYHWHEELEIFYLRTGDLALQVGKKIYHLHAGDIALIPVGTPHGASMESDDPVDFYAFLVHISFLSSFENDLIQQTYLSPIFLKGKDIAVIFSGDVEMQQRLLAMVELYRQEALGFELHMKANLLALLGQMVQKEYALMETLGTQQYAGEWIQKLFNYVQHNYQKPFSLKELAAATNMSEGYLCRSMKKLFHQTPMNLVNEYRLAQAVLLLEQTDQKISYIAEETGFANINRFTQEFKKCKGCTPREYRQNMKQ